MAIEISNFNHVWTFIQPNPLISSDPIPQFYNGTYMFVQCAISAKDQISINANIYDKKPGFITSSDTGSAPVYNGAKIITTLNYGSIPANVENNVLLTAHEYVVSHLITQNPGVDFNIVNLSGSIA